MPITIKIRRARLKTREERILQKFSRHTQASVSHLEDSMIEMPLAED